MNSSLILAAVVISVLDPTVSSGSNASIVAGKADHTRIVGGDPISIKEAPWIVQVIYNNDGLCGGSIVSRSRIVTAAHCTFSRNRKLFVIRAGTDKLLKGGIVRKLSKIIDHPQYDPNEVANDISILFLRKPLKLSPKIALIGINENPSLLSQGDEVTVHGWGRICEGCDVSKTLLAVKLPIVENDQCSKTYGDELLPSMFCCGLENGGKDSCQGDSGGPVTLDSRLVGIVAFGRGCARPNVPGVYTRVSSFVSWIKQYL